MRPSEKIERLIKKIDIDTNVKTDDVVLSDVINAFEKSKDRKISASRQSIWRIIMRSKIIKLATAAVVIIAVMLGMYVLTGSFDGTSITLAQVRQAMDNVDWVQMVGRAEDKNVLVWYSFASKVQILIDEQGGIIYFDFIAGKRLVWTPGSQDIYESDIEGGKQFAGGVSNIYEGLTKSLNSWEAEGKYKVTKEHGTYKGQEVEIWTAQRIKGKPSLTRTEMMTMYIDVEEKLPLMAKDVKGAAGGIQTTNKVEFKYPEAGPANIYEAGAPRSAQIKPSE
jgi:hypothetical protein